MADITHLRKALVTRILDGDGRASRVRRRAAFDDTGLAEPLKTLIDKVTKHANKVTGENIAGARASGFSEDQILELVVCAAIGQATRQHDAAHAALVEATT